MNVSIDGSLPSTTLVSNFSKTVSPLDDNLKWGFSHETQEIIHCSLEITFSI